MSFVQGLVLVHLTVTALLLTVFVAVVVGQHVADTVRARRVRRAVVEPYPQEAGASVLDWTIDLRAPAAEGAPLLSKTS